MPGVVQTTAAHVKRESNHAACLDDATDLRLRVSPSRGIKLRRHAQAGHTATAAWPSVASERVTRIELLGKRFCYGRQTR